MGDLVDSAGIACEIAGSTSTGRIEVPIRRNTATKIWISSPDRDSEAAYADALEADGYDCRSLMDFRALVEVTKPELPDLLILDSVLDFRQWTKPIRLARLMKPCLRVVVLGRWLAEGGLRSIDGCEVDVFPADFHERPDIDTVFGFLDD